MIKTLVALSAFVIAISLLIFVFATVGHAPLIATIESPEKTYVLYLKGKKSRPVFPIIEHSVYFDVYQHGKPVVRDRELHSGDWFDPTFENLYGNYGWVNSSTLMFHRRQGQDGSRDSLNLTNNTSKSVKFLRIQSNDLLLVFDLKPQARAGLSASSQTSLSWIMVEGEFEDGNSIPSRGVNFKIDSSLKGPFTYEIAINDDGLTISSFQLPIYRP